ncbi:MAG: NAD(P)-dependent oxidoreductase [Neomegalonema sp.]|nr:NAD(P)-dependent oxidoreductase [Neomegalonema sp.]
MLIVTGATGFIGAHVVTAALQAGRQVLALGRDVTKAATARWAGRAEFLPLDLHGDADALAAAPWAEAHAVLHLAWPGLPNYRDPAHVTTHLPSDARFLAEIQRLGAQRIVVAGTCFEYGLKSGCLAEETECAPILPYPIAKNALRQLLFAAPQTAAITWARLFYTYGPGQHPRSVLAQLDAAIDRGDATFPMSGGEQLRDYLPVETIAERLVRLAESPATGLYNICAGAPISIRRLVSERIATRRAEIAVDLGVYPYPDYEPMAFWGDGARFARLG